MPSVTARTALLAVYVLLAQAAFAIPELAFPINSQVPPVAYSSQPYSFTFSGSTFTSNAPQVSYGISNGPAWLSLDGTHRTLSGTPTQEDVGATSFQLIASDDDGETASTVTLVVLDQPNVLLGQSLLPSLQAAGNTSAPASLLLSPQESFSFAFPLDVFSNTSIATTYYAINTDNSPLPSWIQFDAQTLSFSGSSPPLLSANAVPQTYEIQLVATNVLGFGEAFSPFAIEVSHHILAFSTGSQAVNVTIGVHFETAPLRDNVKLDGQMVSDADVESAIANTPEWAEFDPSQLSLSGTPPETFADTVVTITVTDIYSDVTNTTISLQLESAPGSSNASRVVEVDAVAGRQFTYTLNTTEFENTTQDLSVNLGKAASWLRFFATNATFAGYVPGNLTAQSITVAIGLVQDGTSETLQLILQVSASNEKPSATSAHASTSSSTLIYGATINPSSNSTASPGAHVSKMNVVAVVLAILLPTIVVVILACLFSCWRRRRKRRTSTTSTISGVSTNMDHEPALRDLTIPDSMTPEGQELPRSLTPAQPPQIDLAWVPDSFGKTRKRLSKRARHRPLESLDSSWGDLLVAKSNLGEDKPPNTMAKAAQIDRQENRMPSPTVPSLARATVANKPADEPKVPRPPTARTSRIVGLPNRISGAGHGAGILSTAERDARHSSWQTTLSSPPGGGSRPSTIVLDEFPPPPQPDTTNFEAITPVAAPKPTLRLVGSQSNPLDQQRQEWHTERAKARLEGAARFSNAGSSRTPSLPRLLQDRLRSPEQSIAEHESNHPSWSQWSQIGPAARTESRTALRVVQGVNKDRASSRFRRDISAASSRQFDSARSSDSQWEDENLVAEENVDGGRYWQNDSGKGTASPRLPFEPFSSSQEKVDEEGTIPRRPRIADERKHASVEGTGLDRSQKSQYGSLRFV